MLRYATLLDGAILVTEKTMPKLYSYIKTLCEDNDLVVPVISISQDEDLENASAIKILTSSGMIVVGQRLLYERTKEEVEAIVAHEIGHIKHNHSNKHIAVIVGSFFLVKGISKILHPQKHDKPSIDDRPKKKIDHSTNKTSRHYERLLIPAVAALIIGKRFEREADLFACKKAGKARGIAAYFKHAQQEEQERNLHLNYVGRSLVDGRSAMGYFDYSLLCLRYGGIVALYAYHDVANWLYYNTPFGPHPSNEDRIAAAEKYLQQ